MSELKKYWWVLLVVAAVVAEGYYLYQQGTHKVRSPAERPVQF